MKTRRPKVLIQMNKLAAYRVPIFHELSKFVDLEFACSGFLGEVSGTRFKIINTRPIRFGRFVYHLVPARHFDYDLIITGFDGWNINSYLYSLSCPQKTILYTQGYGRSLIAAFVRRVFHKHVVASLTYTQSTAQQLIKTGVPGRSVFFTGNTVEVGQSPKRTRSTFLHIGTPQARKRVVDILSAMAMARDRLPAHVKLVLVGPGSELAYSAAAARYGIRNLVVFHDEVRNDEEIAVLFAEAIAFVSGHVGLSAPQAFGYGVPVVTRADIEHGPEFEYVMEGVNSRIYQSHEELADILVDLSSRPEHAAELGSAGRVLYQKWMSTDLMCQRILEVISYVMRAPKSI